MDVHMEMAGADNEKDQKKSGVKWVHALKEEFKKSPVATNASFSFILMGLEKLVETQFECPCRKLEEHWRNALSSSVFFIIPALMSFLLMLSAKIKECHCGDMSSVFSTIVSSVVPSIIWLILLFLDGRYFTCAMTNWEGRYVDLKDSTPQKWCEPLEPNVTCIYKRKPGTLQQCMLKSQDFFVQSQWIGIGLLAFICLGLVEYVIGMHYRKHYRKDDNPAKEPGKEEIQMKEILRRTEEMKQKNINLDDVYEFMLLMSEKNKNHTTRESQLTEGSPPPPERVPLLSEDSAGTAVPPGTLRPDVHSSPPSIPFQPFISAAVSTAASQPFIRDAVSKAVSQATLTLSQSFNAKETVA